MKTIMDVKKAQNQMLLQVGDKVSITANKKTRAGEVFTETDSFYGVQFPNYKECFLKTDIETGFVKVEKLN